MLKAQGFLFVEGAAQDTCYHLVASRYAPLYLSKLVVKLDGKRDKSLLLPFFAHPLTSDSCLVLIKTVHATTAVVYELPGFVTAKPFPKLLPLFFLSCSTWLSQKKVSDCSFSGWIYVNSDSANFCSPARDSALCIVFGR